MDTKRNVMIFPKTIAIGTALIFCAAMFVICGCNSGDNPVSLPEPFEPYDPSVPPVLSDPYTPSGPVALIEKERWGLVDGACSAETGAISDSNSMALIRAIDSLTKVGRYRLKLETGTYCIKGSENAFAIKIPSFVEFDLGGSTLMLMPNEKTYSALLRIEFVRDVKVFNGTIIGDKIAHDYETITSDHGGGAGIWVYGSMNVELSDLTITEVVSDCIMVGEISPICYNVVIDNVTCSKARRDGFVATNVNGLIIRNSYVYEIINDRPTYRADGSLIAIGAQACIAFEANKSDGTQGIFNVQIYNNVLDGSSGTNEYNQLFLNTHGGTKNIVVRDNELIGSYSHRYGSNILFKNNTIRDGSFQVDGAVNNIDSHTGHGKNFIAEGNTFYNYRIKSTGGNLYERHPDYKQNFAYIGNKFYNSDITIVSHTTMALIDNDFLDFEGDETRTRAAHILIYANPPPNGVVHRMFFVNNTLSTGYQEGKRYDLMFDGGRGIQLRTVDEVPDRTLPIPSMIPDWYYESNDRAEAMAFVDSWKWY